jgi:hypothetical protein
MIDAFCVCVAGPYVLHVPPPAHAQMYWTFEALQCSSSAMVEVSGQLHAWFDLGIAQPFQEDHTCMRTCIDGSNSGLNVAKFVFRLLETCKCKLDMLARKCSKEGFCCQCLPCR